MRVDDLLHELGVLLDELAGGDQADVDLADGRRGHADDDLGAALAFFAIETPISTPMNASMSPAMNADAISGTGITDSSKSSGVRPASSISREGGRPPGPNPDDADLLADELAEARLAVADEAGSAVGGARDDLEVAALRDGGDRRGIPEIAKSIDPDTSASDRAGVVSSVTTSNFTPSTAWSS